ncbi:MAG: hypothetical protein PHY90_12250 [Desulfitobacteriaceae bacterium]|nr:hypothetical protein [Desulfitobacteriaceae bacterium]
MPDEIIKKTISEAIQNHCLIDHRPEDAERLKNMEEKIDRLIEVYTAANLVRKFVIGMVGFLGAVTALVYSWLKIGKEFNH